MIQRRVIRLNPNFVVWQSAAYAVVDCVYSAQANYSGGVLPMLRVRLAVIILANSEMSKHFVIYENNIMVSPKIYCLTMLIYCSYMSTRSYIGDTNDKSAE